MSISAVLPASHSAHPYSFEDSENVDPLLYEGC